MRKKVLGVMLLSGAVAGFAGGIELAGTAARLNEETSRWARPPALIVAALALMRPTGVALVAVFFGAVQVGGQSIQTLGISPAVAGILQALILFGAIGAAVLSTHHVVVAERKMVAS